MDSIKLKYHYCDYRFVVTELNLLDPDSGPCIALERVRDGLVIGYTNFGRFVGSNPCDASHAERLEAAARLLSHFLLHMERFGIERLSDLPSGRINEYLHVMCDDSEKIYAGEFVYNLARAGYLTFVEPEDLIVCRERS